MSKDAVGTTDAIPGVGGDEGKLLSFGDTLMCLWRRIDGGVEVFSSKDGGNTWAKEVEFAPNEPQAEATRT